MTAAKLTHCHCENCGADLRDGVIPVDSWHLYGGHEICQYGCGAEPHYSRLIGIYDVNRDRTTAWMCPDCNHTEQRDE